MRSSTPLLLHQEACLDSYSTSRIPADVDYEYGRKALFRVLRRSYKMDIAAWVIEPLKLAYCHCRSGHSQPVDVRCRPIMQNCRSDSSFKVIKTHKLASTAARKGGFAARARWMSVKRPPTGISPFSNRICFPSGVTVIE